MYALQHIYINIKYKIIMESLIMSVIAFFIGRVNSYFQFFKTSKPTFYIGERLLNEWSDGVSTGAALTIISINTEGDLFITNNGNETIILREIIPSISLNKKDYYPELFISLISEKNKIQKKMYDEIINEFKNTDTCFNGLNYFKIKLFDIFTGFIFINEKGVKLLDHDGIKILPKDTKKLKYKADLHFDKNIIKKNKNLLKNLTVFIDIKYFQYGKEKRERKKIYNINDNIENIISMASD